MNTTQTTFGRWKKRILLISLMLVTGAGAVGVSRLGGNKPADAQKTVAKKGDEKPALESGKPGAKNEGGSAGAGAGGVVMVAAAGGTGPADEFHGERRDGASGGGSKSTFDDSIFDMDGPNAPSAGVPGGAGPDARKPEGSFEKVAGGGFGGKDTTGGGGDGGSDPKGGPGNPGGKGGSVPTLVGGGGTGGGGKNPQDSAPIATPVPEPETYAMLLMGLGAVGWVAKRRGKRSN